MDFSHATEKQLYQIATDDKARISDRYAATRELQKRRGLVTHVREF